MKFEWEEIYFSEDRLENAFVTTYRAKVFGGWIIKEEMLIDSERDVLLIGWSNCHNALVFIPDPNHQWEIEANI